jgi:hypothetical protein
MEDPIVRRILIEVAERYERLAEIPEAYTMGRNMPEKESPRGEGHWVDAVKVMDRRADDARAEKLLGRRNRDTTTMSPDLRLGRRAFQQSRKLSH